MRLISGSDATLDPNEQSIATEELTIEGDCGYDDLSTSLLEYCCNHVTFSTSGVECPVTAKLNCESDSVQASKSISSSGTYTFREIPCACTPQSVTFHRGDDTTLSGVTLDPTGNLNCTCEETRMCKFETETTPLPSLEQTKTVRCGDVSITVETIETNDGEPSCFAIQNVSEPILGVTVKGSRMPKEDKGLNIWNFGPCGREDFDGMEFCTPVAGRSGKHSAISYFMFEVWTEERFRECLVTDTS